MIHRFIIKKAFSGNVQFIIKSKSGKLIEHLSAFANEKEVLLRSGSKFKIIEIIRTDGHYKIKLEEI
ncbi:hypothetical protein BWZ22_15625 [Seonamhaeicola sp. S2-3]|uniref:ADP-ribosyltransferase domain-containing protein n=1 Tax=Seonamhaeicola sp. S2-3 TaxID=1936081 RepID=UPI00097296CD|nr:hypothetical protein BWZ22_15625 [Seonamhaeicola sp. S2-3]